MNKDVSKLTEISTLRDAVKIFHKEKTMILPVMSETEKFIGIMTPSSLFKALSGNAGIDDHILPFIIENAVTVNENDDLIDVRFFLKEKQVGQAVVLSDDHRFCGVLDTLNIIQAYQDHSKTLTNSLEALIEQMQTGILALDQMGRVLLMNYAAQGMCNIDANKAKGKHYSNILPELTESLLIAETQSTETPIHRVTINNKKLLFTYKSITDINSYWGGYILIQDLTDYEQIAKELEITKKLETTLQTVLNTTFDGYVVINQEGIIDMINDTLCEFLQKPKETLLNHPVSHILPELKLEEILVKKRNDEKLEAIPIGNRRCLVKKFPIFKEGQLVGATAKIIYKDLDQWKTVINHLNHLEKEVSYYRGSLSLIGGTPFHLEDILTKNEEMIRNKHLANQVAPGFSNVLLLGESGTGKELFARGIHAASNRMGTFVKVNCAAIPADLWESEFFGYADGAFTGAKRGGKPGKFELAHNGTIFLDEIGDMPLSMQVKLLRVLQEKEFERVGGTETISVNIRIIAATNKDLEELVAKKEFREDLYYRLNVIAIMIPPLRERKEDIPLLSSSILSKFSHLMGLGQVKITEEAIKELTTYHWPGNVRELENVIERALNCLDHGLLDAQHLPEYILKPRRTSKAYDRISPSNFQEEEKSALNSYKQNVDNAELEAIQLALKQSGGNRTAAAKLLGISRSQFYKKMKKFELV